MSKNLTRGFKQSSPPLVSSQERSCNWSTVLCHRRRFRCYSYYGGSCRNRTSKSGEGTS